jgi:LysM repeat protein
MNTPNLLKPQGSLLEQEKSKTKSNLFLAVVTILTLHVAVFGGLLIQGCKNDKGKIDLASGQGASATNEPTARDTNALGTLPPLDTNLPPVQPVVTPQGQVAPPISSNAIMMPPPTQPTPVIAETPSAFKEYAVAKNDSFYTIAKAHGVSITAIAKANPNVDSRKLKIGQVLQVPAPASAPATSPETPGMGSLAPAETATTLYTVMPNDNLTRVARLHGTTVAAIKKANNLKTDRLVIGQKLKLPAGKTPEPAPAASPSAPSPGASPAVTLPLSGSPR